jgi:hypothetical protein
LSALLDRDAIDCLIHNLSLVHPGFDGASFRKTALTGLKPLAILEEATIWPALSEPICPNATKMPWRFLFDR